MLIFLLIDIICVKNPITTSDASIYFKNNIWPLNGGSMVCVDTIAIEFEFLLRCFHRTSKSFAESYHGLGGPHGLDPIMNLSCVCFCCICSQVPKS